MIGSGEVHRLSFWYILAPATAGALILLTVALLINNIPRSRRYPEIWLQAC
jgi:CBS-domain-containing membrane protein